MATSLCSICGAAQTQTQDASETQQWEQEWETVDVPHPATPQDFDVCFTNLTVGSVRVCNFKLVNMVDVFNCAASTFLHDGRITLNFYGNFNPHTPKKTDCHAVHVYHPEEVLTFWDHPRYLCIHSEFGHENYQVKIETVLPGSRKSQAPPFDCWEYLKWWGMILAKIVFGDCSTKKQQQETEDVSVLV